VNNVGLAFGPKLMRPMGVGWWLPCSEVIEVSTGEGRASCQARRAGSGHRVVACRFGDEDGSVRWCSAVVMTVLQLEYRGREQ
jgi:hypothetical protein